MPKPYDLSARIQHLPLDEAIDELRENLKRIDRQVDEAFPDNPQEAAAFRVWVASILDAHRAGPAALDKMEAGLLRLKSPAGTG
jgi:hypothetical protein